MLTVLCDLGHLQEYKQKLARVTQVRKELKSHIQSLPDLSLLPNVTGGLAPLPSAGDLFSTDWEVSAQTDFLPASPRPNPVHVSLTELVLRVWLSTNGQMRRWREGLVKSHPAEENRDSVSLDFSTTCLSTRIPLHQLGKSLFPGCFIFNFFSFKHLKISDWGGWVKMVRNVGYHINQNLSLYII